MVKHAADKGQRILTAEERVDLAMSNSFADTDLSEEQQKWLNMIREHLIENLTIDEADFDAIPIFFERGGQAKARRIFGNRFNPMIQELNSRIAA